MKEIKVTMADGSKAVHTEAIKRLDSDSKVDEKGRICCCVSDEVVEELKNMPEVESIQVTKEITETETDQMVKEPEEKKEGDEGFAHHEEGHDDKPAVKAEGTVMDEYTRTRPDGNNDGVPDDTKAPPLPGDTDAPLLPVEDVKVPKKKGRKSAAEKAEIAEEKAADAVKAEEEPDVPKNDEK
jgi:hypothetical protein